MRRVSIIRDVDSATIKGYRPVPYQVDGDYVGESDHIELRWAAAALSLVVPVALPAALHQPHCGRLTQAGPVNNFPKSCCATPCAVHNRGLYCLYARLLTLCLCGLVREQFHKRDAAHLAGPDRRPGRCVQLNARRKAEWP